VNEIVGKAALGEHRFSDVVVAIAESAPFQLRRGDPFRPDEN